MLRSNISRLAIMLFVVFSSILPLMAQQDSVIMDTPEYQYAYQRRIDRYYDFWNKLIPRYAKIQYAGSMGFISIGTGWDYGKNKQWETDFIIGYVPKYTTSDGKLTFTLKQNFIPWRHKLGNRNKGFTFEPLACGAYINTLFGHNYWTREPDRNSNGYYTFATKLRFNIYIGQRITYRIPEKNRRFDRSITFFYELSSNDIYMVQGIQNDYLKLKDCVHLSFGLKFQFLD